jgi:folate-binding protein YgfZ
MSEVYKDDRTPSFGFRILQDTKKGINDYGVTGVEESPDGYKLWRMLNGVPEGQKEIIRDTALLQESCIDYMGGVDFRKGCYVGQELVIRTQHTGVVRKRILPVRTYPINRAAPSSLEEGLGEGLGEARGPEELQGKDIKPLSQKGRSVGKYLDGIGNIGLALCRLEEMGLSGESAALKRDLDYGIKDEDGAAMVKVRAFIPEWWQHRTKASNAM